MNIAGAQGRLKPSPELFALCADPGEARAAMAALSQKSLITFRKFNGEYCVWQGSDFDFEAILAEQLAQIERQDIVPTC